MSTTPDNPCAFPVHAVLNSGTGPEIYEPGMRLRDYFAGQVLAGLFAGGYAKLPFAEGHEKGAEHAALLAYRFADAMLAARVRVMTTEDDFQRQLDADPDDWQCRLVFADWLQDRDDSRADGYRALGALRLRARALQWAGKSSQRVFKFYNSLNQTQVIDPASDLPSDWFDHIPGEQRSTVSIECPSRREAEDAAALAFASLPAHRRAELLATAG